MSLKIYIHRGPGHYVGSSVIVLAESADAAAKMVRKELDEHGLESEEVNIGTEMTTTKAKTVHVDSGDY